MKVVELASFELASGIEVEDFLVVSTFFQMEFVEKQPGFISRNLIKRGNRWSDLVVWQDMKSAENVSKAMGSSLDAKDYGRMIAPESVKVEHYELYQ